MTEREAMKLALDALVDFGWHIENCPQFPTWAEPEKHPLCTCGYDMAIAALRQALEQPRQECETCANKRRRLEQAGFLKSPLRGEEKQFFYGQDPNVLPASNKGESHE